MNKVWGTCFVLILAFAKPAWAESMMWLDDGGNIYFAESIYEIPYRYRYQVMPEPTPNYYAYKRSKARQLKQKKNKKLLKKKKKQKKKQLTAEQKRILALKRKADKLTRHQKSKSKT